jgi:hypothetical protein
MAAKGKSIPKLTIAEGFETAREYTTKASEITRNLGLAGLGIIWVFKTDVGGRQIVPPELFLPGLLLVLGLAFDLLQYVVSAEAWIRITRWKEDAGENAFTVPPWLNHFGTFFYWLKILAIGTAYFFLMRFLASHVFT